jgi:hypothetical protein
MDDRPSTSIWGTILSCAEIALCVYQVVAINGEGLMVKSDNADELLGKAIFQGKAQDGYLHFEKDSLGEQAAAYELIKNGHITDPEVVEQYGTPEEIEANGKFLNPEYFGELPEPEETPWGALNTKTPIDNGVFFLSTSSRTGIAVHKTVAEYCMSDYARNEKNCLQNGDYYFYDLNKGAAVAVFELSATRSKVLDLVTSWESLMHTLATKFPDYTDYWNSHASNDTMIYDVPAPSFMFLQQHLDEAAKRPAIDTELEDQESDNFFERVDPFDEPEIE